MQIRTISAVFLSAATIVGGTASRADASPFLHGQSSSSHIFADVPLIEFDSIENGGGGGDSSYPALMLDRFTASDAWSTGDLVVDGLYVASIEESRGGDSWYSEFDLNEFVPPTMSIQLKKHGLLFTALKRANSGKTGGSEADHSHDGAVPTPEPGTLLLVATGIAGAGARRYRSRKEAR